MSKRITIFVISLVALIPALLVVILICASPSQELTIKYFTTPAMHSVWRYDGFAEYMVSVRKLDFRKDGENTRYRVEAEVDDMSGDEPAPGNERRKIELQYLLTKDTLIQSGQRKPLMDAEFRTLELLRLPLKEGARWTQTQKNELGETVTIDCQITNLQVKDGRTILDVTYSSRDGDQYEWRRFLGGDGLSRYEKRWKHMDEELMIGFNLLLPVN